MASCAPETPLLGVSDGAIDPGRHRTSYLTNKVGGRPDWPPAVSPRRPRCGRCGVPLAHVAQVYCPLDASPYHRNLHLFACTGADCSGRSECWVVLRSQCLEAKAQGARTPGQPNPVRGAALRATDWCDAAHDWGSEGEEDDWGGDAKEETQVEVEMGAPQATGKTDKCKSSRTFFPF